MKKLYRYILKYSLAATAMLSSQSILAATAYTWIGTTSDLTLNANWTPNTGHPVIGDSATFIATGNTTPTVSGSTSSSTFFLNFLQFNYSSNTQQYTFHIQGANTIFSLVGNTGSVGVQNIATTLSSTPVFQQFNIFQKATLEFQNIANADIGNTGTLIYNVGDTTTASSGTLLFLNTATAGAAKINVVESSTVTFHNSSSAQAATFSLGESTLSTRGSLIFDDSSTASTSTINAKKNSSITFNNNAQASTSTINLGDTLSTSSASLIFNNSSSANNSVIHGVENSVVFFQNNSSANSASFIFANNSGMIFNHSSTSNNATINLTSTTSILDFNQTSNDSFHGTLLGSGTINKFNTGTLNFFATANAFTGTTKVLDGLMMLNTPIGGNVIVQTSGTLGGNSTVLGNLTVNSGGTVSPGNNTIDTLHVNGNYIQNSGGIYHVEVHNSGSSSLINVGGTATLNSGSSVNVTNESSASQLPLNTEVRTTILHANGGVNGTITNVTSNNPLYTVSLSYDPHNVFLTFKNTLSTFPETYNQRQIAIQLQSLTNPSPSELQFLNALASLSMKNAQFALDQTSAEVYTNLQIQSDMINQKFIQRLYNPLRNIMIPDPCCNAVCYDTWNVWMDAGYDRSLVSGNRNAKGFKSKGYEITLGAQNRLDCDWTVGAAAAYDNDLFQYNLEGHEKGHTYSGGLYALYRPKGYYIFGDLTFGYSRQQVKRTITVGTLNYHPRSTPKSFQEDVYIEAGADVNICNILAQPFIGFEAGYFHRNNISEYSHTNSFLNVNVLSASRGRVYSRLGVHLMTLRIARISWAADLVWRSRLGAMNNQIRERFKSFGSEFNIKGVVVPRNSFEGLLNFSSDVGGGWELYGEASGSWCQRAISYRLLGGFILSW